MHIIVSNQWLDACGMGSLIDVPLKVVKHTPMWSPGESMYEVELPDGRKWVVWSIRGVHEVDDPSPVVTAVVAANTSANVIRTDRNAILQAKRKVKRRGQENA